MNTFIPKVLTVLGWAVLFYNLIVPFSEPTATWLNYGLIGLVVTHAIEVVVFMKKIQASDSPGLNVLLVLIFGYFRASELPAPAAQ